MAYRQPRVPEYREDDSGAKAAVKALILFLKDFSLAAWSANGRRRREIAALAQRVTALEEKVEEKAEKEE